MVSGAADPLNFLTRSLRSSVSPAVRGQHDRHLYRDLPRLAGGARAWAAVNSEKLELESLLNRGGRSGEVAVIGRLFRELQLRCRMSLSRLEGSPLTARPTQGVCDVALLFHIDRGRYEDVPLDGLNVALVAHAPGPMAEGNWTVAGYIDERADDRQTAALGAIFTGAEGGPMAAFAPLITNNMGVRKVPITYTIYGKIRSAQIPGVLNMAVEPLATMHPSGEIWAAIGHPVAPDKLALAFGSDGSTFADYGMCWDNSGKNGHYAPINWSN